MAKKYEKSELIKNRNFNKMDKDDLIRVKGEYAMEISHLKTIKYSLHEDFDRLVANKKYRSRETKNVLVQIRLLNTDIEILRDYYQICRNILKEKYNFTL